MKRLDNISGLKNIIKHFTVVFQAALVHYSGKTERRTVFLAKTEMLIET